MFNKREEEYNLFFLKKVKLIIPKIDFEIKKVNFLIILKYTLTGKLPWFTVLLFLRNIFINHSVKFSIYIAVLNNKVISHAFVQKRDFQVKFLGERYLEIGPISTRKQYRNNYVASSLINYILQDDKNVYYSIVRKKNITSNKFFTKFSSYESTILRRNFFFISRYINNN